MASALNTRSSHLSSRRPVDSAPRAPVTGLRAKPWWRPLKRGLTFGFFALVIWLLIENARAIEWGDVWKSIGELPLGIVFIAALFAGASHLLYSCFDLLGRHYTGHWLKARRVMLVTFISYAFNLNMGSLVGGVAFRYRLYSQLGLTNGVITRVLTLSMLTNWFGYFVLAGLALTFHPLELPPQWKLGNEGLQWLGMALLALASAYMGLCAFSRRRTFNVRGHEITLPRLRMALLQLLMSCVNWSIIGGAVWVLLQGKVDYVTVLSVLLVAAVAGVITHVPAGLGVLEAVFIALLSHQVPQTELLAALLAYRALYYIAPLAIATVLYIVLETRIRQKKALKAQKARPGRPTKDPTRARLRHSHGG
ncbi:MAG: lysylphosphatidylglycerol synthase domain-containing protein [Burkholderiaceae bacterium]